MENYVSLCKGMQSTSFILPLKPLYPWFNKTYLLGMAATGLAKNIMRGISLALGGVTTSLEGHIAGDPFWMLRLNGYPPIPNLTDATNGVGW